METWLLNSGVGFFFVLFFGGGVCVVCCGLFCLFVFMERHCLSDNEFPGKAGLSEQVRQWNHAWKVRLFIVLCTGLVCEVIGGQHVWGRD